MERASEQKAKRGPSNFADPLRSGVMQRRGDGHSQPANVPPIVYDVLRTPGLPLDESTRSYMEPRFAHDFSNVRLHADVRMPTLVIGSEDDQPEQEADCIAHRALRAPDAQATRSSSGHADGASRDNTPRFGHDFSQVRVHSDSTAATSARALMARAYTVGSHIVFDEGQLAPTTHDGRSLLAHELAHTAQQSSGEHVHLRKQDAFDKIVIKKGQTLYGIAKEYGTTVAALRALNSLRTDDLKEGQTLKVPVRKAPAIADAGTAEAATPTHAGNASEVEANTGAADTTVTIRGDLKGDRRLLVAWTIDDGPRGATTDKMKKEGMGDIPQVLWFIQYANIKTSDWRKMRDIQAAGGEVGIHSFYQDDDHAAWFPMVKGPAYGQNHVDDAMPVRMAALKAFNRRLNEEGLVPKFVRVPGGLISELSNYAMRLGASATDATKIANAVLAGVDLSSFGKAFTQIAVDFTLMKKTLTELNMLLWGSGDLTVNPDPGAIGRQEWTAETSGASARVDTTTDVVDPSSLTKSQGLIGGKGQFEKLIGTMKAGDVRGMVVLAHDTTTQPPGVAGQDDVRAVKDDREHMEAVCSKEHIILEYRTMSSLFNEVTGKDVATYRTAY